MAWRMKIRLPNLKITQSASNTFPAKVVVPRGRCRTIPERDVVQTAPETHEEQDSVTKSFMVANAEGIAYSSLHEINETANASNWAKIRPTLLRTLTELCAMPIGVCCCICGAKAESRCLQCGATIYYCLKCFKDHHSAVNIFHMCEVWDEGTFKPLLLKNRKVDVLAHECLSEKDIPLCCIDAQGIEHEIMFACCDCEPTAVTLVRARLWPASPCLPKLAFAFELLEWAEALLLECQVALGDFCRAIYFKCQNNIVMKRKEVCSALINAFEEFRFMKVELRHLSFISDKLDKGNTCPACPKEKGTVILSLDALFGLPRKKSSGQSHREPLHGHIFFKSQSSVDEHVASAPQRKVCNKVCNDFLAGDVLRSSNRFKALDETALFGCGCRHEFPLMFVNLKHGERISYAEWLLQEIVQSFPAEVNIHIMYDIACTLKKYVEKNESYGLLERVQLSLPSFHAFGHKPQCQIVFSPLRCEGLCLSDGEVMERLWSFLRRFSRMTKEMRPFHRTDILCHALIYYGHKTKQKLGPLLLSRWKRAEQMKCVASKNYQGLTSVLPFSVTEVLEHWIRNEKDVMLQSSSDSSNATSWTTTYFLTLHSYYFLRDALTLVNTTAVTDQNASFAKFTRVSKHLLELERRHGVKTRWTMTDPQYIEAKHAYLKQMQQRLKASLWSAITRRQYLLKMKAKYGDGQKIAKRLCKGIAKETSAARKLLDEINASFMQADESFVPLSLSDVVSPHSEFWNRPNQSSGQVPLAIQRDIIGAYLLQKRCTEELMLLQNEMQNVVDYYNQMECNIKTAIFNISEEESQFSRGCVSLLKNLQSQVSRLHLEALSSYSTVISRQGSQHPVSAYDVSDSSDSEYASSSSDIDDINVDDD